MFERGSDGFLYLKSDKEKKDTDPAAEQKKLDLVEKENNKKNPFYKPLTGFTLRQKKTFNDHQHIVEETRKNPHFIEVVIVQENETPEIKEGIFYIKKNDNRWDVSYQTKKGDTVTKNLESSTFSNELITTLHHTKDLALIKEVREKCGITSTRDDALWLCKALQKKEDPRNFIREYLFQQVLCLLRDPSTGASVQPKTRIGVNENGELYLLSKIIPGFITLDKIQDFPPKIKAGIITGAGSAGIASYILGNWDNHKKNSGLDEKNRIICIDIMPGKNYPVTAADIQSMPYIRENSEIIPYNWLGLFEQQIRDNEETTCITQELSHLPRVRKEVNETLLRFILLPEDYFQTFAKYHTDNEEIIKEFIQFLTLRLEAFRQASLLVDDFRQYVLSPESRTMVEQYIPYLEKFCLKKGHPIPIDSKAIETSFTCFTKEAKAIEVENRQKALLDAKKTATFFVPSKPPPTSTKNLFHAASSFFSHSGRNKEKDRQNLLFTLISKRDTGAATLFLKKNGDMDINKIHQDTKSTPLIEAIKKGDIHMVKLLLEHKADSNKPVGAGFTPLMIAVKAGLTSIAKLLLEHNADKTVIIGQYPHRKTAPMLAIENGTPAMMSLFGLCGIEQGDDDFGDSPNTLYSQLDP